MTPDHSDAVLGSHAIKAAPPYHPRSCGKIEQAPQQRSDRRVQSDLRERLISCSAFSDSILPRRAVLSVVLVEAHVNNVVPARRVMALEALINTGMLFPREFPGDHREVFHRMARGRLMTLHTLLGP